MTFAQRVDLILADLVLVVHVMFVAFVIVGLMLIWIGGWRRWDFVRNIWFRLSHLAAIGIVAAESIIGFVCPLTTWEDQLRLLAGNEAVYQDSFLQHWLHKILFFEIEPRIFTITYVCFFLVVVASFWFVPLQAKKSS